MEYGFEYSFPDIAAGAAEGIFVGTAGIVTGVLIIFYLLALGYSIVCLVLNAVGMYRIAKRRGIHHAWLAWIPIGNSWLLGSISDHYQYVAKQKVTKRRKILLIMSIVLSGISLVMIGAAVLLVVASTNNAGMAGSILSVAMLVICYLAMIGLSLAIVVFCYIASFDLFRSCRPEHDVLFLILGIFFGTAIFVFACSGYDKGMPERRVHQPAPQIPYVPQEPVCEEMPAEEIPVVETEIVEDSE